MFSKWPHKKENKAGYKEKVIMFAPKACKSNSLLPSKKREGQLGLLEQRIVYTHIKYP